VRLPNQRLVAISRRSFYAPILYLSHAFSSARPPKPPYPQIGPSGLRISMAEQASCATFLLAWRPVAAPVAVLLGRATFAAVRNQRRSVCLQVLRTSDDSLRATTSGRSASQHNLLGSGHAEANGPIGGVTIYGRGESLARRPANCPFPGSMRSVSQERKIGSN
jgi:hypothetical protein